MTSNLAYMSVKELSKRIQKRELSPVELLENQISRIETRNNSINAFVYTDFEEVRKNAKIAEAQIMDGEWKGPLRTPLFTGHYLCL